MTIEDLKSAEAECQRFLQRVKALTEAYKKREKEAAVHIADMSTAYDMYFGVDWHPAATGAVRRASMDLTRALAKLRRY